MTNKSMSHRSIMLGSLSGRPMKRVTDPLAQMGAAIETTEKSTAPLRIKKLSLYARAIG
ncbi:MAG: hypothetical protein WAX77_03710 [Methylococcaceae bacterium]